MISNGKRPKGYVTKAELHESIEQFAERLVEEKRKLQYIGLFGIYDDIEMHITIQDTVETIIRKYENGLGKNLRRNAEHYDDPTAYEAITHIERDRKCDSDEVRVNKLMGCIFRVCELAGFHVEERIVVKDLRTGKVWR